MKGLFIYGGCVTRDSFESLRSDYRLLKYVARQSLISSGHPSISVPDSASELPSTFQQHQLRGDITSSFFPALRAKARESDAIILDLVVERLGVRTYQQGFLTNSHELARSKLGSTLTSESRPIPFASPRHFQLWGNSARRLVRVLQQTEALERTVVFDTPWADRTRSGASIASVRQRPAVEMNRLYRPYLDHLQELGLRVERLPDRLVMGDDEHKWGQAAFHYVPEAYDWMAGVVRGISG